MTNSNDSHLLSIPPDHPIDVDTQRRTSVRTGSRKETRSSRSFSQLPAASQKVATNISAMGFPMERVARIAAKIGNDEKKVFTASFHSTTSIAVAPSPYKTNLIPVSFNFNFQIIEHLISVTELLDLGFDETKISDALLRFDNNKDRALDYLIS